ncbi:MAG: hypothetical protein GY953_45195, partial [bacterium]|nr:hypothetical protein [bacterium]
ERRYDLVRSFSPHVFDEALETALDLARKSPDWRMQRRSRLLEDKIDVTGWMIDFFHDHALGVRGS